MLSYRWLRARFDRSGSFKVIDCCTNRTPIYELFMQVINWLTMTLAVNCSVSETVPKSKTTPYYFEFPMKGSLRIYSSKLPCKRWGIAVLLSKNRVINAPMASSPYTHVTTHDRLRTYDRHLMTIADCNVRLKTDCRAQCWLLLEFCSGVEWRSGVAIRRIMIGRSTWGQ